MTPHIVSTRALGASLFASVLGLASTASAAGLFTEGHGDFSVGYNETEGEFEFGYHLGEGTDTATVSGNIINDEEFGSDELRVRVANQLTVPASISQDLLDGTGATVGSSLYLIDQNANGVGSIILGLGTEELGEPAGVSWSDVTYTLTASRGPGLFSLYQVDNGVANFRISEAQGISSFTFPAGGHEEQNWAFTAPGTYELDFTASATRTVNGSPTQFSETGTFTFAVPEPSTAMLFGLSSIGLLVRRRH